MKNKTARREIESLDYYLQNHTTDYSEESHMAMMMAIKALEQQPKMQDCEHCIHTYGILGCCDMVNNEWVYDCVFGKEQYKKEHEAQPCEDCISREAVKEMLTAEWTKYMPMELDMNLSFVLDKISALPSVTPQQKNGHWIDIMVEDIPAQACNKCKTFYPLAYTGGGHKYCPNCGAKMEVEE